MPPIVDLDAVVFGGGVAGLWTHDALRRAGRRSLLLESQELGGGQTIASQGIIHGGLKYTLSGILTPSARAIRAMPGRWRSALAGETEPDLSAVRLRAEFCHLWRTDDLSSRVAMIGARAGLAVAPRSLSSAERPGVLTACPGAVARLDEQVIEPGSLLQAFADRNRGTILRIDGGSGLEFDLRSGDLPLVRLIDPDSGRPLDLRARHLFLIAGAGNADLRSRLGLDPAAMQRRPLHMVMIRRRGLPELNGHCVDGRATRATVTSTRDSADRVVWQLGGRIAEEGVGRDAPSLVALAREELRTILPGVDLAGAEWSTYRVDRAESAEGGRRPEGESLLDDGRVLTAWPTKLALAPRLADRIVARLDAAPRELPPLDPTTEAELRAWPRPVVARPPWEEPASWIADP